MNKTEIINAHKKHETDTGSTEVQIALLTTRINELTEHLKSHKHDNHSKMGLFKMIGKRKKLLKYYERINLEGYKELINKLNIRK
ncbi:MAG: 30S ribosomal protein S15 [Clostridia bacterium]|nr:30S ribosomal protein S15 [Clostridia bacterium]